jgi:hypothetical protein
MDVGVDKAGEDKKAPGVVDFPAPGAFDIVRHGGYFTVPDPQVRRRVVPGGPQGIHQGSPFNNEIKDMIHNFYFIP